MFSLETYRQMKLSNSAKLNISYEMLRVKKWGSEK